MPKPGVVLTVAAAGAAVLVAGLPASGSSVSARQPQVPSRSEHRAPTIGVKGEYMNGEGWGTVRPKTLFNGGDPSGLITHIHWSSWGGRVARGTGKNAIFRPNGGYYSHDVTIKLKAIKLRPCPHSSRLGYSQLIGQEPSRPGGPDGKPFLWAGNHNLCKKAN